MAWVEVCANCQKERPQEYEPCLPSTSTAIYTHTWVVVCHKCNRGPCICPPCRCVATITLTRAEVDTLDRGIACMNYGREDWSESHRRIIRKLGAAEFSPENCELH